jgi:Uma2 family endonuclease
VSTSLTKTVTADELLAMPDDGYRYALVKGELIQMSPTGLGHGIVAANIVAALHQHVKTNNLGVICSSETGFLLTQNPDTVLAPDAAFICRDRLEAIGQVRGYWIGPPDLAVEVLSPGETKPQVARKVSEWLSFGTRQVWIVNPKNETVTVYRSTTRVVTFEQTETLEADDLLPGFRIAVKRIFEQ